jgi:thymidylate synthase
MIDQNYQQLLGDILANGTNRPDRTGAGRLSVFGRQIRHKMGYGFPLLTTKKMYFKGIAAELIWFLRGDTNIKWLLENKCSIWTGDAYKRYQHEFLYENPPFSGPYTETELSKSEFIVEILENPRFAARYGELGPIYGKQWRKWQEGIDQISNLIESLKTDPFGSRHLVNAWNVGELKKMVLPPCHYGFQCYVRELTLEEKIQWVIQNRDIELENVAITEEAFSDRTPKHALSLMWNQRSVDTFLGLPFNIASYGLLLHILAQEVNMVPDELIGNLGDVHLYQNHLEQAKLQLKNTPYDLPYVKISKKSIFDLSPMDFDILNYESHAVISAPLNN